MSHHHHHDGPSTLAVAVLTVTTTRDETTDESGPIARDLFEAAGHEVEVSETVPDDRSEIQRRLRELDVDVVLTTGGTGLTPDDVTVEAVRALFEKEIPGFGEHFRRLSHESVGTPAMLSRATAGVVNGTLVYALPGNPDAVSLGVDEVVLPEVEHAVALAGSEDEHGSSSSDH